MNTLEKLFKQALVSKAVDQLANMSDAFHEMGMDEGAFILLFACCRLMPESPVPRKAKEKLASMGLTITNPVCEDDNESSNLRPESVFPEHTTPQ